MADGSQAELVFVVDVSSFTKKGFVGSSEYERRNVSIEFDDDDKGVFLTNEMAKRLRVKKGTPLLVLVDDERLEPVKTAVAGIKEVPRISNAKIYYGVGKEGGAVIRVQKA